MVDSSGLDDSATVAITGKIMVTAIIILFLVVVFVLFLLYAKWFWWRIEQPTPPSHRQQQRRRRFVFAPGQDPAFTLRRGLDPAILRSIPILTFDPQDFKFKDGLECAVCLSEFAQGEKARLLPKCNHGFHVDCIDMWFQSHSTCPLCRNPVALEGSNSLCVESPEELHIQFPPQTLASGYSLDSPNFPTNVLFWGNETQVSTGGASLEEGPSSQSPFSSSSFSSSSSSAGNRPDGMLTIDIPVNFSENSSSLSPTRFAEEESKSPMPTRLRSLKRLLSREKRVSPTSSSASVAV